MRKLIALTVIVATLYGGYWFVGRSQIQSRLSEALVQIDASAYNLRYDSLNTRGFPSRFDTTVTGLVFEDPATAMIWSAPVFQLLALSYRPNEVIAVFPNEQTLSLGHEVFTLMTRDMRASGKVRPNASLAFETATIEMDNPRIRTQDGAELAMAHVLAAMRLTPDTTQTYDAYIQARAIALPENIRAMIDPQNLQPSIIQSFRFDSDVTLTAPIELNGANLPAQISALSVKEFALTWGDVTVAAIGDMVPDTAGRITGSISLSARNWRQALDMAIASGMVGEDRRFLIAGVVNNMDETPHIPDTLTLTLMINDGSMSLGGFPLGPAPLLR